MAKQIKAVLKFLTGKESALSNDAKGIGEDIELVEAKFKSLSPKAADGLLIIKAFADALSAAKKAGVVKTAAKNEKKKALQSLMRNWAAQVSIDAGDDMELFLESGFTPRSTNHSSVTVTVPNRITVTNGANEGKVKVKVSRVRGAHSYSIRYAIVDPVTGAPSGWVVVSPTTTRTEIAGLTVAQTILVSARAHGVKNSSDWAEPVSFRVGVTEIKAA